MKSELPTGWAHRRLGDCGTWFSGGTPPKSRQEYWGEGIPWVGPKDLHERYVEDAEDHLTELGVASATKLVPEESILLVVRSMALAKRLQIGFTRRQVAFNQDIKAILAADDIEPRFLFFALWGSHDALHALVDEASHGTKRLRTEVLADFVIPLPSHGEQKRITEVLSALDDKIESNRRLAERHMEAAEAVFRERFTEFIGVDDFEKSDIGPIPRGWRVLAFSDAVEINPRVRLRKGEVAPYIEMAAVGRWAVRPTRLRERAYSGGSRFEPGDTLMARITGCIEHGKGAFVDFLTESGAGSTEFLVFRAKPPLTREAVFLLSRNDRVRQHAIASMTGSSGRQRVPISAFDDLKIAIPPDLTSWQDHAEFLRIAFAQGRALWSESRTLTGIRDALLPKLITGEIRVPDTGDVDEAVGAVVEEVAG